MTWMVNGIVRIGRVAIVPVTMSMIPPRIAHNLGFVTHLRSFQTCSFDPSFSKTNRINKAIQNMSSSNTLQFSNVISGCSLSPFDSCWKACTFQMNYSQNNNLASLAPYSSNVTGCSPCSKYLVSSLNVYNQEAFGLCDSGFSQVQLNGQGNYVQISWVVSESGIPPCITAYTPTHNTDNVLGVGYPGMMYGYDGVYAYWWACLIAVLVFFICACGLIYYFVWILNMPFFPAQQNSRPAQQEFIVQAVPVTQTLSIPSKEENENINKGAQLNLV